MVHPLWREKYDSDNHLLVIISLHFFITNYITNTIKLTKMAPNQITMVQDSWARVKPIAQQAGELFYSKLFIAAPYARHMFKKNISEQAGKLMYTLTYIVNHLDRLDTILDDVQKLAVRHNRYEVKPEHYTVVGQCLIETLSEGLGDHWNNELQEAWVTAYTILSNAMIQAQENAMPEEKMCA